jgi:chorismate mutase
MTLQFPPTRPFLIAGPCSAESPEQLRSIAKELKALGAPYIAMRAGVWKPRTRPGLFEGNGEEALKWLADIKKEFHLPLAIEVANTEHVELALKYGIDILWIGARTSVNPFSVQEIAESLRGVKDRWVLVKNPINPDLGLWIGAFERLQRLGQEKLMAVHRGFSTYEKTQYRNRPLWQLPIEFMRKNPHIPLIVDPSHIGGNRAYLAELAQKGLDINAHGLMIETHPYPEKALSDAEQQLTPKDVITLWNNLTFRNEAMPHNAEDVFKQRLGELRDQIDQLDSEIIQTLELRKKIVTEIATLKAANNVTPVQLQRLDQILTLRRETAKKLGLNEDFIVNLFESIHTESVRWQWLTMNQTDESPEEKR